MLMFIKRLTLVAPLWLRLAVVTTGTRRSVPQDSQQVYPYCCGLKDVNLGTEAEDAGYDSLRFA